MFPADRLSSPVGAVSDHASFVDPGKNANHRVVISRFGGPEVLDIVESEIPQPGPGAVRVRIFAAGLSGADLLMREGVHPRTPRTPFTSGWDLVGFVDELGPGVTNLPRGAMSVAMPIWGSHA